MTLTRVHRYAWVAAALTGAFLLELAGTFRAGSAAPFFSLILILCVGFFGVRWFAGFLALWIVTLSLVLAPFWVLDVGGVALMTLLLLVATPLLTGNRFFDFLILIGVGAGVLAAASSFARDGEVSLAMLALTVVFNLLLGACAFRVLNSLKNSLARI